MKTPSQIIESAGPVTLSAYLRMQKNGELLPRRVEVRNECRCGYVEVAERVIIPVPLNGSLVYPRVKKQDGYQCPNCTKKRAELRLQHSKLSDLGNVPPRYSSISFNHLLARNDLGVISHKSIYLVGPMGVGKTVRAHNLRVFLEHKGYRCSRVWELPELFWDIRQNGEQRIRELSRVPYLFLDDFGTQQNTEYQLQCLYQIVNTRWLNNRPIMFTSNVELGPAIMGDNHVAKKTVDRIRGMCDFLYMAGISRR